MCTRAFQNNAELLKVSFAENSLCESITTGTIFGYGSVFTGCTSLREADFTNARNLTNIESLFQNCSALYTVKFAESLASDGASMSIGDYTFQGTVLTSFTIPAYVTSIASNAFENCEKLETIEIAEGNTSFTVFTDANGNRYDQAIYTWKTVIFALPLLVTAKR